MKYHTSKECCVKLKAIKEILITIKAQSSGDHNIVHSADSAAQLIEELFNELNNKEK
jgi:hypothetical protein